MASGSDDCGGRLENSRALSVQNPVASSFSSTRQKYTYRLTLIDRSGLTKTVDIKYADFHRVTTGGTRVVFRFDTMGVKPDDSLLSLFGHYIVECSKNYEFYPISGKTWSQVSPRVKTRAWEKLFLTKFYVEPTILSNARKYFDWVVGLAWEKSRLDIWKARKKHAEQNHLSYDWVLQNPPQGCPTNDWLAYMDYVDSKPFEDSVIRNKDSRTLQEDNHHSGRFTEQRSRKLDNDPRGFYSLPNGEFKNTQAEALAATIRQLEAAGCPPDWGPNDSLAQAMNKPEHHGHIWLLGPRANKIHFAGANVESSPSAFESVSSNMTQKRHSQQAYNQLFVELKATQFELAEHKARIARVEQILSTIVTANSTAIPRTQQAPTPPLFKSQQPQTGQ